MPCCFLGLGGNVGPVEQSFARALEQLDESPRISVGRVSSLFCSMPVGENAGGEFRNAAAEIETNLEPLELLDQLQQVEDQFGRTRTIRWGPRTLDLDLLFYGIEIIDKPRLRVPHPACWYRRFVLDPLVEIAADFIHPEKGISLGQLHSRLTSRPFRVALAGSDPPTRLRLIKTLQKEFGKVEFAEWAPATHDESTLIVWLGSADRKSLTDLLPQIPRLDISPIVADHATILRHVLHSAGIRGRGIGVPNSPDP